MKTILLAAISVLLLILSFPKFNIEFLAWFALVPLFLAIKDKNLKSAFGLSFLTGIGFFMGVVYWINIVNGFKWHDFILLGVYLSSYFGLFGLAFNFLSKKTKLSPVAIAPVLWVSLEYLRSHAGILAFPWALLGHSQYLNIPIIQISSFTGVYGVSFLIVMANVALCEVLQNRFRAFKPAIATLCILGLLLFYGFSLLSKKSGDDKISITVIQGNFPPAKKWKPKFRQRNLNKYVELTKQAVKDGRNPLIVWPESAIYGPFTHNLSLSNKVYNFAKKINSSLLIGSSLRPKFGSREFKRKKSFSSAFLISGGGIDGIYNKIHLLPFNEYLPFEDLIPWSSRLVSSAGNSIPGNEYTIFNLNESKFGVTICWENIFPDFFRIFVKKGANFMINITNENLFGETAAPYQFLAMSVFRAVENRRSIARSANTGISGFIDPYGRILGRVKNHNKDIFVEGYLTMEVPLSNEKTFYTKYGDVFAYMNLIAAIFMLGLSVKEVLPRRHKGTKVVDSIGAGC